MSAVFMLANLPWTIFVMDPTNEAIFAEAHKEYDEKRVKPLFKTWSKLKLFFHFYISDLNYTCSIYNVYLITTRFCVISIRLTRLD